MCIPDLIYKPTVEPGNRIMILENWDGMMKRGFTPEYCEENEIRFIVVLSEHLTFDFLDNEKKYIKWFHFDDSFKTIIDGLSGVGKILIPKPSEIELMDEEDSTGI